MKLKKEKSLQNKFSNISVFERRENNIMYTKNFKKYVPLKLYHLKRKLRIENEIKKKNSEINDILCSFYVYQLSEGNKEKNSQFNDKGNVTITSLFNKTTNNFKNSSIPFYLTETEPSTFRNKSNFTNKRSNFSKYNKLNKNLNKGNNIKTSTKKFFFENNYKTFGRLIDYFGEKEKENKPKREINKTFDLMDLKITKIKAATQDYFYNTKQYIHKTRKLMLLKYDSLIHKEKKFRIDEKNENSQQFIDDKIHSLNKMKKLCNDIFNEKIIEYVKFISLKKDEEEKYDLELLNQIYSLKKEISFLTNKLRKIQFEKNYIIEWILLQIKVKERKLNLPSYYTKILEMSIPKLESERRSAKADVSKVPRKMPRRSKSIQLRIERIKSITKKKEHVLNNIDDDEFNKILNYRRNLVFKTPNDFLEGIKDIEFRNMKLFNKVQYLLSGIKILKERYNNLLKDKDFLNYDTVLLIKKYEKELEENKHTYFLRKQFINEYIGINIGKENSYLKKKNNSDLNLELDDEKIFLNKKNKKLFNSVERLYSTCMKIKISKGLFKQNSKDNIILQKANLNNDELILNMIKLSEIRISHLLMEFMMYKNPKNPNYDFIKKLRMNYKKKRNMQKANLARIEKEKNNLKLFQEIEEKNNQFLFLQKTKKDLQNQFGRVHLQIPRKQKVKLYMPNIEDFLFDELLKNRYITEKNKE